MLKSHSLPNSTAISDLLEHVVCDYCGHDDAVSLGHLPPKQNIIVPMHRMGVAALDFNTQEISFVKCRQCGLIYMNPRMTDQAIQRFYDTVYAIPGASTQFESHQQERANYILGTTETFLNVSKPMLLDIGCGGGQLLKIAQQRGWEVTGSELSSVAAESASQALGIPIYHGDFRDMAPVKVDVITMKSVVEHLREPMNYLQAAVDLLKPGGVIFFNVPNYNSWERYFAQSTKQLWRGFIIEHLYYFTPSLIRRFANDLDVDVLRMNSWVNNLTYPNPLAPLFNRSKAANVTTSSVQNIQSPIQPEPVTLPKRILRYSNQLILDTVAKASNGHENDNRCNGNALFVWLQKPHQSL